MSGAFLGIDVGTFETKGVLVSEEGTVLGQARRAHRMIVPQAGWAEHDAEAHWWGEFAAISRELVEASGLSPERVLGVGASGIGPCMLPVDAGGNPLMNAVLYGVDTRAHAEIAELTGRIGEAALLERTGNALTSQSVGPKILWLKRNRPEIFDAADGFVNSTTFLVERLTGRRVLDHYSAGSFQPLYDVAAQDWADDLMEGIAERRRLPELLWTTEIAGRVTPDAARATGLAAGTPVIAGTIDAAAEAVSVGVSKPGDTMMMYGSTVFIIQVTESRGRDARLWYAPWLFPGCHALMSGLATSGTLTHWFRDRFARELPAGEAMGVLAAEAAASPAGARGLLVLPYFSGERTPIHDPHAKGMFFGLDLTHERGDLFRATLEGIAYGVRHVAETYAETGNPASVLSAVGGGTKNAVWSQAVSDVSGLPQLLRRESVGASLGSAFLAALGTGRVVEADIERWNPPADRIEPRSDLAPLYEAGFRTYRELYERTRDLMRARS
ncbi:FGGY-family carbohydrate kinase [Antarcticirhabdus aurantiaca]|uniref:FGGY-family carbohydrate kinase n=1 Tax=Antarcticirhabdus aurantiaca TaxID=2606717 RepID=A0ACD4NS80_9HYPH|nr:FGGY-family carbohydrate kinase [Antarcticirhabdus aurantiaca]WAJ29701.1 FGGY-family carbohydrate kinase [Jeongeuplla avenae]